jgi:hypothetical protein
MLTGMLAAAGVLALVGGAAAQAPSTDAPTGSQMMMGPMAGCPMGSGPHGVMGGHTTGPGMMRSPSTGHMGDRLDAAAVDAQLTKLHDELGIRADQEELWTAYAAAARADAQSMASMHASVTSFMQRQSRTAPDWLGVHRDMMQARADSLSSLAGAVDALYAVLDSDQRATFDRTGGGMCGAW